MNRGWERWRRIVKVGRILLLDWGLLNRNRQRSVGELAWFRGREKRGRWRDVAMPLVRRERKGEW